ncbi:bath-40 [Symbiodinium necroappetens]|uniref:Bath-40 protein n=1 Tax=Symbiodinium necroappetens TaxID=1628268 RepID=A0A813CQF9_9DINO|nr:bath-40 [Symbiodinium necroappetens]
MSNGSKRKRQPAGLFTGKDLCATSDVWNACFGQDGNFKVIVKEPPTEASKDPEVEAMGEREFKVWSSLLANWSPVFEKMIRSDTYAESKSADIHHQHPST